MKYLVLALLPSFAFAQTPSQASMHLLAPNASLTAGEQIRLSVVVRGSDGVIRPGLRFLWSSGNAAIASVADGLVTARGIGQTRITATVEGEPQLSAGLNVQSLPRRIEVTPNNSRITVGETLQFVVRALDLNNAPIANVPFTWTVTADSGNNLNGVSINNSGLLTAQSTGRVNVAARVAFQYQVTAGAQVIESVVPLRIDPPKHFEIKSIWRSSQAEANPVFRLPAQLEDPLRGNDRGQVLFQASVGDQTRAMLMVENGQVRSLSATGDVNADRIEGRQTITGFGYFSLNHEGDALIRAHTLGPTQLLMAGRDVARPRFLGGSAEAYNPATRRVEPVNVSSPDTSRHSLADTGDIVVQLQVTPLLSRNSHNSLFRISPRGVLQELISTRVDLPGMPAPFNIIRWHYGVASDLRVFFLATSGTQRNLYALDPDSTGAEPKVERILGIGDEFQGSRITQLDLTASPPSVFIGADGELIVGANLEGRGSWLLRWPNGDWRQPPQTTQRACCGVYGSSVMGSLVRSGNGLVLWKRDNSVAPVLVVNTVLPNGERVTEVQGGAIDAQGIVTALVGTNQNASTLLTLQDGAIKILLRSGDTLPIQPRASLRPPLLGNSSGDPWVLTAAGSVLQLTPTGPQLRLGVADPLLGNSAQRFTGQADYESANVTPEGVEIVTTLGLLRVKPDGQQELLFRIPITPDVQSINRLGMPSPDGHRVWVGAHRSGDTRVLLVSPSGEFQDLGANGSLPQNRMRFDDVEVISFYTRAWLTDDRRVLMDFFTVSPSRTLSLWENGVWRAIGVPGRTRIGSDSGPMAVRFDNGQTAGNRIFAEAELADGTMVVVEWMGDYWRTLVTRLDRLPNGTIPAWAGLLGSNRKGELLVSSGEGVLVVRRNDGTFRYLLQRGDSLDGNLGGFVTSAILREDGTVYLTVGAPNGEVIIYQATPL